MNVSDLVSRLQAAANAYHNGMPLLMTDAEFDAGVDALRAAAPDHPFLAQVGAPITTGDEVALPIPLPSLNKIKPDGSLGSSCAAGGPVSAGSSSTLEKWLTKFTAPTYHVSVKLDGCSALWLPATKKLYTRGDGMRGRDISAFVPYIQGLATTTGFATAVRGELIMRTDSPAIPAGKLARNIVAGALNRKDADPALFSAIRFIAYEMVAPPELPPAEAFKQMRRAGYECARDSVLKAADMTAARLSELFSTVEAKSEYQLDGIVVAPNVGRPAAWAPEVRKGVAVNPADRVAWKTRLTASTATTTVRAIEWNISHGGMLIPRVLFDTVTLAGANISAATGLHGRWIYENAVGPGAQIEVRRAGDVIPQIIAVHVPAPAGPAMPPAYTWDSVHIRPAAGTQTDEHAMIQLTHALTELGAENVGPGIVAKLYTAGFRTLRKIYAATPADFAAHVAGVKAAGAQKIHAGLRVKQDTWSELTFLLASCCMPRGVGASKLKPLLEIEPNPAAWTTANLTAARPAGLSVATIETIVAAIPAYLAWRTDTGFVAATQTEAPAAPTATGPTMTVVFTGFRDKALEAALQSAGHTVAASVTKKTTHLVHADGAETTSTKFQKAQELGITILSASDLRVRLA